MKNPTLRILLILTVSMLLASCFYRHRGPYRESSRNCGMVVLKPLGKAVMTKCGDIMWKEEGTWKRQGDTIQVYFRHYTDRRTFVVKKGKLHRVYDDGRTCKPNDRVRIEQY